MSDAAAARGILLGRVRRRVLLRRTTFVTMALLCALASRAAARDGGAADAGVDAGPVDAGAVDLATARKVDLPTPSSTPLGPKPEPVAIPADIALGERKLCTIRVARNGVAPAERASAASRHLDQLMQDGVVPDIRVTFEGSTAIVRAGTAPLVQLGPEDATAAGDASVSVHAESCAASIREGLRTEARRRAIANLVFSLSLVVLAGLLAFLSLGVVSRAAQRVTASVEAREDLPGLKIGTLELLTPAAIRVGSSTAISIAKPIVQVAIVLGWFLSSLSLFAATAAIGRRMTGYVIVPLSTFFGRLGASLPLVVLVGLGAFTLAIVLRFLRIFFDNVEQGGIRLGWLAPGQALPASLVARVLAIVCALLAAAPLLGGDGNEWGALRVLGVALTATVALAMVPSFSNVAVGCVAIFTSRYRTDDFVEVGPHSGRIVYIALTHFKIADRSGAEVRVPHLLTLVHPVRVLGDWLPSRYEVVVDSRAPQGVIRKALVDAVRRQGQATHVELTDIEGERAVYIVLGMAQEGEEDLASAIADSLTRQNVAFSRIRKLDAA